MWYESVWGPVFLIYYVWYYYSLSRHGKRLFVRFTMRFLRIPTGMRQTSRVSLTLNREPDAMCQLP